MATEEKKKKESLGIHSISFRIIAVVLICILVFTLLNVLYIIPKSKEAVQASTEKNMQDIATFSALLVQNEIDEYGVDGVTPEIVAGDIAGKGLSGIPSSFVYVVDETGTFLYHKNPDKIGTQVINANVQELLKQIPTGSYQATGTFHYTDENGIKKYTSYQVVDSVGWVCVIAANETEVMASINKVRNTSINFSVIIAVILVLLGVFASKQITKPIQVLTNSIKRTGDLDFSSNDELVHLEQNKDETGVMARAVEDMEQSLRDMVGRISVTSSELEEHASKLSEITYKIDSANADNSATSEELAASMQETSASTDLISDNTKTIKENADSIAENAQNRANVAKEIRVKAQKIHEETVQASEKTQHMYEEIDEQGKVALEKSKAVEKVNQLAAAIQDIASQTNLLALNASIEAARAGEAGRGFAVVATEIGALAEQSSNTVADIMNIVAEVQSAVNEMSTCLQRTLDYLSSDVAADYSKFLDISDQYQEDANGFAEGMSEIYNMIGELQESTTEISSSIEAISKTVGEAADAVTTVAEKTTDVAMLSTGVVDVVSQTKDNSTELKDIKDSFIL